MDGWTSRLALLGRLGGVELKIKNVKKCEQNKERFKHGKKLTSIYRCRYIRLQTLYMVRHDAALSIRTQYSVNTHNLYKVKNDSFSRRTLLAVTEQVETRSQAKIADHTPSQQTIVISDCS